MYLYTLFPLLPPVSYVPPTICPELLPPTHTHIPSAHPCTCIHSLCFLQTALMPAMSSTCPARGVPAYAITITGILPSFKSSSTWFSRAATSWEGGRKERKKKKRGTKREKEAKEGQMKMEGRVGEERRSRGKEQEGTETKSYQSVSLYNLKATAQQMNTMETTKGRGLHSVHIEI